MMCVSGKHIAYSHPDALRIPFHHQLFGDVAFDASHVVPLQSITESQYEQVLSADSVNWSNRGKKRPLADPHECPRINSHGHGIPVAPKVTAKSLRTKDVPVPAAQQRRKQSTKKQQAVVTQHSTSDRRRAIKTVVRTDATSSVNEEEYSSDSGDVVADLEELSDDDTAESDDNHDYFRDTSTIQGEWMVLLI